MAKKNKEVEVVKHGSEGHDALLASGYGMTVEDARMIIKERAADSSTYSIKEVRNAQAMIAAFEVGPKELRPISTTPRWVRQKTVGVR
ncbi:unnamed protein product [marine sediment metagenome]|uniref:Uncharacterized protein n=1 Tax=marine sediment metagenome TaxID=412755 RepID=X1DZG9_9ZZZZ